MKALEAGHIPDSLHSGAILAASGTKVVTLPQSTLLDETKLYAVCYAETSGSNTDRSWRDSLIRLRISKMEGLESHGIKHLTNGQIAREGNTIEYIRNAVITGVVKQLHLTYSGSLSDGAYVSMVDETGNNNFPCASGTNATASVSATSSGVQQATGKVVTFDTKAMSTATTFAVCYTEGDGTAAA